MVLIKFLPLLHSFQSHRFLPTWPLTILLDYSKVHKIIEKSNAPYANCRELPWIFLEWSCVCNEANAYYLFPFAVAVYKRYINPATNSSFTRDGARMIKAQILYQPFLLRCKEAFFFFFFKNKIPVISKSATRWMEVYGKRLDVAFSLRHVANS